VKLINPPDEAKLWNMAFRSGFDYFNHLGFDSDEEMHLYAEAAWKRCGKEFLKQTKLKDCWALREFGEP
jgi:hypothetical protein